MSIREWADNLVRGIPENETINFLLVIVNSVLTRVDLGSTMMPIACKTFFKGFTTENSILVFTHCDLPMGFNEERAKQYADEL